MYCNSCMSQINKDDATFCQQCGVPLHNSCANHCLECGKTLCDNCYATNNYYCEACYRPEQSFKTIRRSHIELYNTCPYALYLQLVKGVEPPANEYAVLGTIIHHVIDLFSNDIFTFERALEEVAAQVAEQLNTYDKYEDFMQTALKSIHEFATIKSMFGTTFETEKNIIFSMGDNLPSVSCTLDRIDFVGDAIHISDWKTGKPMSGQKLITDLQAPLYIQAVKEMYGKYPETFTFYYLANNKVKQYKRVEGDGVKYVVASGRSLYTLDVEEALVRTKDILTKINNKQFSMPTEVHQYYCTNMCYFYKSGICSNSDKEQWKILNNMYKEE